MRVNAGTIGSVIELRTPRAGQVQSVFTQAVNLEVGDELWTVTARGGRSSAGTTLPSTVDAQTASPSVSTAPSSSSRAR